MCALQEAHVGFPAQHTYACAAGECICACVLTGAHLRVPLVLFPSCNMCVPHVHTHTRVSELDMCV